MEVDDKVEFELYICRDHLLGEYIEWVIEFEDWIDSKVQVIKYDLSLDARYKDNVENLFLYFVFGKHVFVKPTIMRLLTDALISEGQKYDNTIVTLGQVIGTYCPDCGVPLGSLHVLGCSFEQCACCEGRLASCLCGMNGIPFGWQESGNGPVPKDDIRMPYGDEIYYDVDGLDIF